MKANAFFPSIGRFGAKWYPEDIVGGMGMMNDTNNYWFVDGDKSASGGGQSWEDAYKTIQEAVTAASAGDTIFVAGRTITALATDPLNYAETVIIPNGTPQLSIIGVSRGRTQGGLPQMKIGAGSTAMMTVRAPGCLIANMGFNGASSTGGGILLDDDGGTSKVAFGTTITGCHFKNCVGSTATDAATGGAIMWSSDGGAWQVLINGNRFYKNVGDIVMKGTSGSVPQDVVVEDNIFSGPAASVDCNIYVAADGINGLIVRNNVFTGKPAIGSGSNAKYMVLGAGTVGILAGNYFASITGEAETDVTFGASGAGATIPTTVFISGNFGETGSANTNAGEQSCDIFRT